MCWSPTCHGHGKSVATLPSLPRGGPAAARHGWATALATALAIALAIAQPGGTRSSRSGLEPLEPNYP